MGKTRNNIFLFSLLLLAAVIPGCTESGNNDTPTTGKLTISVDETFKPLMDTEVSTFESIYTYAKVNASYKTENDCFNDLMNDSIKLIIVSRSLNRDELKQFEKWEIVPKVTKVAYDAVALIGSRNIVDSNLTLPEIRDLLSGINLPSFKDVKVVFDNSNSGTVRDLMTKTGVTSLSSNCYALNSNQAVIDYVSKENNTIGVIGVNWISDKDDTTHLSFLSSVKVLEIADTADSEYYKPYQAYIAQKFYPLRREVFIISKEAYTGLGTGFTAFVASDRGQRIILKSGLVPATMPVRFVELINEDITIR